VAAELALRSAGIDPSARGETLDLAAFVRLAAARV
jgi:16S rRNA (adenine1518-N6/adenine1519-N6)-dimethyltransferase